MMKWGGYDVGVGGKMGKSVGVEVGESGDK